MVYFRETPIYKWMKIGANPMTMETSKLLSRKFVIFPAMMVVYDRITPDLILKSGRGGDSYWNSICRILCFLVGGANLFSRIFEDHQLQFQYCYCPNIYRVTSCGCCSSPTLLPSYPFTFIPSYPHTLLPSYPPTLQTFYHPPPGDTVYAKELQKTKIDGDMFLPKLNKAEIALRCFKRGSELGKPDFVWTSA